jgi:hypothetical protein
MSVYKHSNADDLDILYQGKDMSDLGKGLDNIMQAKRVVRPETPSHSNYDAPKFMLHPATKRIGAFWNGLGNCIDDTVRYIPGAWRTTTNLMTILGVASVCYFGMAIFSPNKLLYGSLDGLADVKNEDGIVVLTSTEEKILREDIGKYCYNKIPFLNDSRVCINIQDLQYQHFGKFEREVSTYQNAVIDSSKQTIEQAKADLSAKTGGKSSENPTTGEGKD